MARASDKSHYIILGNLNASPALAQKNPWLGPHLPPPLHRVLWDSDLRRESRWQKGFEDEALLQEKTLR